MSLKDLASLNDLKVLNDETFRKEELVLKIENRLENIVREAVAKYKSK